MEPMNSKRRTLQKIAGVSTVASVIPKSWIKPVINSVILPAHAQTSTTIELTSDENIGGNLGSDLQFLDATLNQFDSNIQFLIRVNADLSRFTSTIGPHLSSASLSTETNESIRLGGCDQDQELATIIEGINTLELNFTLDKGKTYTNLNLQFYPIHCAPSFLGAFIFRVNVIG